MARVKRGVVAHARHKKVLKAAKGYYGREHGLTYGRLIDGLNKAGIEIDRKVLAHLAYSEPEAFKAILDKARAALPAEVQ